MFIKKRSDLQQILDHQVKLGQPIKLEISVRDEERRMPSIERAISVYPVDYSDECPYRRIQSLAICETKEAMENGVSIREVGYPGSTASRDVRRESAPTMSQGESVSQRKR
jgi:hypothetical protein